MQSLRASAPHTGQDWPAVEEGISFVKQAAVELSSAGGPLVIKEGLCGLLSTASLFLLPSPSSLSPGLSTPCKHKESNCCSQAMCRSDPGDRPRSLTCLESQPGGWGRGSGRGAWGVEGGRSNPRLSPFSPVWKTPAPEEALPLEVGPTGSWGSGNLPSPAEFSL